MPTAKRRTAAKGKARQAALKEHEDKETKEVAGTSTGAERAAEAVTAAAGSAAEDDSG